MTKYKFQITKDILYFGFCNLYFVITLHGKKPRTEMQTVPTRRRKALLEGRALLFTEMRYCETKLSAWAAWVERRTTTFFVWRPLEGKTEGEADVPVA